MTQNLLVRAFASSLSSPLAGLGRAAVGLSKAALAVTPLTHEPRVVQTRPGHAYVRIRGLGGTRGEAIARDAEAALHGLGGVHWAKVNPILGAAIVSFADGHVDPADLAGIVGEVEEAYGSPDDPGEYSEELVEHPADTAPVARTITALVADAAGVGFGIAGQLLRIPALPVEIASALVALDSVPPITRILERRPKVATGAALFNAALQGLGQGPLGLVVDGAQRVSNLGELAARRRSWLAAEDRLCGGASTGSVPRAQLEPRPEPLPQTLAERYAERSALGALGVAAVTLGLTRDPRRTADLLLAGVPKAARVGIEGFAGQIGRSLSDRGVVVMDPRVLRRLDLIDTVVIEPDVLIARGSDELRPMAAALIEAVKAAAHDLVIAGKSSPVVKLVDSDFTVPGGTALARSIRRLQADGRVVALVSTRPGSALVAADCGIGIVDTTQAGPPWGADVICTNGADASAVIDASRLARTAGHQAVAFAAAGSVAGGLLAFGPRSRAGRRAVTAVQLASLAAMGAGVLCATRLPARQPGLAWDPPWSWHSLNPDEVITQLGTSEEGLSEQEALARITPNGDQSSTSIISIVSKELSSPLTVVLGVGAALSAATGSLTDAALISGVVGLDATIGVAQRLRTEAAINRLSDAIADKRVTLIRGGRETQTVADKVVRGDVINLSAGDAVPADCRLVDAKGLEVDESSLTGESIPVVKDRDPVTPETPVAERSSILYSGTSIAAGRARAVVVATGRETEAGQALPVDGAEVTGVESRLTALTNRTLPVILAAGAGLTANGLLRGAPLREAVGDGVSLAASAVPEGLPFVATIAQAASARRLARSDILVRNPQVLEALGRVDVLCFDKTGTLTEGRLRLTTVSDGLGDRPVSDLDPGRRGVLAAALRATPRGRGGALPHPTDQAVVDAAQEIRLDHSHGAPGWKKTGTLPFEPGRGYHAVGANSKDGWRLSVKGAPEVVLPRCSSWRRADGSLVTLDESSMRRIEDEVERLARAGLRVLAVGERNSQANLSLVDDQVRDLELVGLIGVADEARATAARPLGQLQKAGIHIVMITGDHPATAEAVAAKLGILNGGGLITGSEMDEMDDEELERSIGKLSVFARVTPAHKVRIVRAFQRSERVVAMTGDGANDAQAIRMAQVGVAFGSRCTPAAREAADILIARDDLDALIETMIEGRAMWASVRDSLAILLGGNLGEVLFTTGAALVGGSSPLNARQLLTVNLFTDLAPALVIAAQPPRSGRVHIEAEGPETSLSGRLARDVALRAAATSFGAYSAWLAARFTGSGQRARTVALAALVGSQLGQTIVIGRRSPLAVASSLVSAAGLAVIIETPGVSQFFGSRPLGPVGWGIALAASAGATVLSVLVDRVVPTEISWPGPVAMLSAGG